MRRHGGLRLVVFVTLSCALAAWADSPFDKSASAEVELLQASAARAWCPICGMDLRMFFKTNHALQTPDGRWLQTCSLHCLVQALDGAHFDRPPSIRVVDAASQKWIDARSAIYVLDSSVPGTMSRTSKIAFARQADALAFQTVHGGRLAGFSEASALGREQMENDNERLLAGQKLKLLPAGKRLYLKACPRRPRPRGSVAEIKVQLAAGGFCPGVAGRDLQMVALYLHASQSDAVAPDPIACSSAAKCPVCGMFVAKDPAWIAHARGVNGSQWWFDGAKDLFKFILQPGRWGAPAATRFDSLRVTHYYSQGALDAREARYVIGSDVLGPMGHELIPLADEAEARQFMAEHHGERVLRFEEVDLDMLETLDAKR